MSSMAATTEPTTAPHDHHGWCDPAECVLDREGEVEHGSHYGVASSPTIDPTDALAWRCAPDTTHPELFVRPIDFDGHIGVEVNTADVKNRQSTSGSVGVSWLTPTEARELAAIILRAADDAEGGAR